MGTLLQTLLNGVRRAVPVAADSLVGRLTSGNIRGIAESDLADQTDLSGGSLVGWDLDGELKKFPMGGFVSTQFGLLTSNFTTTSTSMADVTGLSFDAAANARYLCKIHGTWKGASSADGLILSFSGPSSPSAVLCGFITQSTSSSMLWPATATAFSTNFFTVTGVNFGGSPAYIEIFLILINGSNDGTVQLRMASETGGSTVLYAPTALIAHKIP